eukprot:CAMPEP_0195055252 /NCGR_PEP_ID=MMETSP0448-20130528/3955_1 /TAXON_ID=66468 /ORGANISM="Heterocapsa triquestra, Strain CCMP 448" /LENGTH=390 /DNA_ID=CAMNT_0040084879 /DNA_START=66 /DNA_END=1238 /DNA_ORIENTATION=-
MKLPSIFGLFCTKTGSEKNKKKAKMDSTVSDDSVYHREGGASQTWHSMVSDAEGAAMPVVTKARIEASMFEVSSGAGAWDPRRFKMQKTLQEAIRNHGRVDLMTFDGNMVAVKRMPTRWVKANPKEFNLKYPTSSEQPWYDMALVRELNTLGCPYVCDLIGVFRDHEETFVVSSLCTEGDLFGWCDQEPAPGKEREALMPPIVSQMFTAVRWLHELGIAHRDLSLENILLTKLPSGEYQLKLIDFGMSTLQRTCRHEVRGKQSYQAPEMHEEDEYDTFLADEFAIGVVLFAMAAQDYPWTATKRGSCQLYEYVSMFGLKRFLEKRKLRKGNGEHLIEIFSPALTQTLEGLLEIQPRSRATMGESMYRSKAQHRSVWDMQWAKHFPAGARF